jgi:hypothetical protein
MKTAIALILLAALVNAANAHGSEGPAPSASSSSSSSSSSAALLPVTSMKVEVNTARIHSKDVIGSGFGTDVDLGLSPAIGTSRIIERAEIERAYVSASAKLPKKIPASVRITRKTRRLAASEVVSAVREALADKPLPRGATLMSVRAAASTDVPADYHHVKVEMPTTLPRRAGPTTIQAIVSFIGDADVVIHKSLIPLEIVQPPEAAFAEIQKGAPISLVVRRGLVEVSVPAFATVDADVGNVIQVTLKPSGRVLRARAIDKDHAVALEDSQS